VSAVAATTPTLVGQDAALALMARAAERPVHAYLLAGSDRDDLMLAARVFAGLLVAPDEADGDRDRAVDLVRRGSHPDVLEFEPAGTNVSIRQVREEIVPEAWRSPIEAPRKVLVIFEAEGLCRGGMESANALLKTFEEPPETTVMLLVTAAPDELIETVRSRLQRIDLTPLDEATVIAALVAEGHDTEEARAATRAAGSQLGRARRLLTVSRALRASFVAVARELDGTGARVARGAGELATAVKDAIAALEAGQADELAEFDDAVARGGYPPRVMAAQRRRLTTRHERHARMARREALIEGITALETVYRDALAGEGAPPRNLDETRLVTDSRAAGRALEACRVARQSLERNPNEGLLLERLLFQFPSGSPGPAG